MKQTIVTVLAVSLCVAAGCGGDDDDTGSAGGGGGGSSGAAGGVSAGSGGGSGTSAGSGAAGGAGMTMGVAGRAAGAAAGSGGTAGSGSGSPGTGGGTAGGGGSMGSSTSGVAASTRLDGLSASDKQKLCAWGATLPGVGEEMPCPDGSTVEVEVLTGQECLQSLDAANDCPATVGQFEACIDAQLDEPCQLFPSACNPIFACLM
jgi:hypothetical protein